MPRIIGAKFFLKFFEKKSKKVLTNTKICDNIIPETKQKEIKKMTFNELKELMLKEIDFSKSRNQKSQRIEGKLMGMYKMWRMLGDYDENKEDYYFDLFMDILGEV